MTRMLATRSWKPWAHRLGTSSSTISIFRPLKAGFSNRCSLWSGPSWGQRSRVSGAPPHLHTKNRKNQVTPTPCEREELKRHPRAEQGGGRGAEQMSSHQSSPPERETEAQRGPSDSCPSLPSPRLTLASSPGFPLLCCLRTLFRHREEGLGWPLC